jgi:RNA polymerase sigma factor (sigma-70 family)
MGRDRTTQLGGPPAPALPATSITLLHACRSGGSEARRAALERLAELYWKPVYCLIRRTWNRSNEDAKDLAQEFFVRIVLDGGLVERYDADRGGFRALLRASLQNFLRQEYRDAHALKRGGEGRPLSLEEDGVDLEDLQSAPAEEVFDRAWERVVFARAATRAKERLDREGRAEWWEALEAYELGPSNPTYEDLAARFGIARDTVKVRLACARQALLEAAREVLADTAASPEEIERELLSLLGRR